MSTISYASLALTVDGTANGILTVATTGALRSGAIVYLSSATKPTVELKILSIASATTIVVGVRVSTLYVAFDASAYTVADSAKIVQPDQYDFNIDDYAPPGSIKILDENVQQATVDRLNFLGANVSANASGDVTVNTTGLVLTSNVVLDRGDSSASPGAAIINKPSGRSAFAIGANTLVITNSLVTVDSIVIAVLQTADATLTSIKTIICGAGSFTITGNANATAATKVGWVVFN